MRLFNRVTLPFLTVAVLLAAMLGFAQSVNTLAGNGNPGYSGDTGFATSAQIDTVYGVAIDANGNLFLADCRNHRVRKVTNGVISTVAGTGQEGSSGDGGAATAAQLSFPRDVAVDSHGNLYIADTGNSRIRKVTPGGVISTVAGTGTAGFAGDGGAAASAQLSFPGAITVDPAGNLYIADSWNYRVRKVTADGNVQTIVGNGSYGPFGDGGSATAASLGLIESIALDGSGTLYLSDSYNHMVRKVTGGTISTVVGGGFGPAVDGVSAATANLKFPRGIAVDWQGNLLIADSLNSRIRKVSPGGLISTVAGNGTAGFSGDGGAATTAQVNSPAGLAVDSVGHPTFSDQWNYRVRSLGLAQPTPTPTPTPTPVPCSSTTLSPGGETFPAAGGTGTFSIATDAACSWSVSNAPGWLSVTGGATGTGNGTVSYQVFSNSGGIRSGTLAVAGRSFGVQQVSASAVGVQFLPVPPCRVADTRGASGAFGGPTMTGGSNRSFVIPDSVCGIPATALAYSVNLTVVPSSGRLSYLTLWPTGQTQPIVSTLNSWDGRVVANAAIVPAGTGGAISVYVTDRTDLIIDINGYFTAGGSGNSFYALTPCRVADTRWSQGPFGGPSIAGQASRSFTFPSSGCSIPATAQAYSVNATVVPAAALGYLTLWPASQAKPLASTLNSWDGQVVANAALVPAGSSGGVSAFVTDQTELILDVNGYFGLPGGAGALRFYPVSPCRVADTRGADGPFGGPTPEASATRSFAIPSSGCGVPNTAAAYALNVTVVPDGPLPYLSLWPTGQGQPNVSTLNSFTGRVVANAAIVPAGTGGAVSVFVAGESDVILDVSGYFAP